MAVEHYSGSCQCGKVAYEVDVDLDSTVTCNCSRCQRLGSVLAFAPRDSFRLTAGEGETTVYRFNKEVIEHHFCPTCGIQSFAYGTMPDGSPMASVNVNCLKGVDPRALTPHHYDGANS